MCLIYCFHYKVVLFSLVFSIYLPFLLHIKVSIFRRKKLLQNPWICYKAIINLWKDTSWTLSCVSKNKHMMAAEFDISEACSAEQVLTEIPYTCNFSEHLKAPALLHEHASGIGPLIFQAVICSPNIAVLYPWLPYWKLEYQGKNI